MFSLKSSKLFSLLFFKSDQKFIALLEFTLACQLANKEITKEIYGMCLLKVKYSN